MSLFTSDERQTAVVISNLSLCNPFLPERIEWERRALGDEFEESAAVWSRHAAWEQERPNVLHLYRRTEALADAIRDRLISGARATPKELELYEDLINYLLYNRFRDELAELITPPASDTQTNGTKHWLAYRKDYQSYIGIEGTRPRTDEEIAHLFAWGFQIRRAFHHVFQNINGGSLPAARLRAAVWQSIFTHDMRRYHRVLFNRLGDFTTLITGPSGTGKELVARAIGLSRYVPFDPRKRCFVNDGISSFFPLNLSALSPTLIESELFGHRRGAFTGAVIDRVGWLENCGPVGTVFLDEIGELEPTIQVKLLRVLQTRTFQRLGDTTDQQFRGKIIAATNRDMAKQIRERTIREDFYYRLCSDIITTPSLHEQLQDRPADLGDLVLLLTQRILGSEADEVAHDIERWIQQNLGPDYAWPGNIRELEQCIRNVIIRGRYTPSSESIKQPAAPSGDLALSLHCGSLSADELLAQYCAHIYLKTGSYEQTAIQLKLDRRTVKTKVAAHIERTRRDEGDG